MPVLKTDVIANHLWPWQPAKNFMVLTLTVPHQFDYMQFEGTLYAVCEYVITQLHLVQVIR